MRTIIGLRLRRFRRDRRGVSNIIVIALSLIIITLIVSNIVLWSYQMNQLDWEKMREDVKIANVARITNSSWFVTQKEYSINVGSRISGTFADTQAIDNSYERFREASTTLLYNPSGYALGGSTSWVAGGVSDLTSDNGVYMTFRSYVSASSTTAKTNAIIAYRDSTTSLSTPKERTWIGDTATWSSQSEMATAGSTVRFTRVAYSPIEQRSCEKIVVTLSDDGYLDAYIWDGTAWNVTNNIGQVWTTPPTDARRPYDIAYESLSGKAILVYGTTVAGGTNDLAYRIWTFGTGWGPEQYYDDTGHASKVTVTFVALASDPNSDEIGMVYIDSTNSDANAVIWNGSSWNNFIEITGTVAITTEECIAIVSESVSGAFMAVAGEDQFIKWTRFTTSWSTVSIFDINSGATGAMNWLKLAPSQNNRLMLTSVDASSDLCTAVWDTNSMGNRQWSTATESIGSMTSTTSVTSMRFTAQASKSVTNILVYIQRVSNSPAYRFGIETSTAAYLPSGTYVGGASNYAVATPNATGWLNLTLPSPAQLTAGTVYHVTVRHDSGTISAGRYIAIRRMGTAMNNFRSRENTIDPWLNTIFGTTIQNRDPVFALKYSDETYEAMPYDTATAHNIFGANWFSEKWTQVGSQTVSGVNLPLIKTGTPPDNLYIVLRNETDSQDVATITVPQGDITTTLQWYEKYFDSPVTLISGKEYRLILKSPSSTSSAYFTCRSLSTSQAGELTYDGTNSVYSDSTNGGSSWTDTVTRDLTYILLLSNSGTMGWIPHPPWDTAVDTNAQRCADFAWEYRSLPTFRNQGLLVYGTTAGRITWRRFRAPNYMTAATSQTMGANVHPWVQLKSNPRDTSGDVKILGAVLEGTVFDLGAIRWDGTTFAVVGTTTFSTDTAVITYESFEIEFMNFGPPTEFASEVEFVGISNAESWTQLVWTIDSSFTATGVTATFQLYNYQTGSYPTSGDGYLNDTIGTTDITESQTIATNPTYFRDSSGNWRIRAKGVKTTTSQFDFKADCIEFKPTIPDYYSLNVNGTFTIDILDYPLAYIQTVEIQLRYRADDAGERWYVKAYNWTSSMYSDSGFNSTAGHTPTTGWDYHAVNLTDKWRSYVRDNGTICVQVVDEGADKNQTTIDIDFLGVRATINGTLFTFQNESSLTSHLVSLWVNNSTNHRHYDIDVFVNSGETFSYQRVDVSLPRGKYTVRAVTDRGNTAIYAGG